MLPQDTFPVIDSTLSPEHLTLWVAQQYQLPDAQCKLLKTNMNHSYLITSGIERYILRIYNHKHHTLQNVTAEVEFLNEVKAHVNVSYPIADINGQLIQQINAPEGMRYAVLFSYAPGKKERYQNIAQVYNVGVEMANLHQQTLNREINRVNYSIDKLVKNAYHEATAYISESLDEMKWIRDFEPRLQKALNDDALRKGIVHLDIWYDNMSVDEGNKITFFDFDNCGNGPLILDLGYFCLQQYCIEPDKSIYEQKKAAFIEGYRTILNVSDEELALIPYAGQAIWIYYLGLQAERFNYFANLFLSDNYVKMYLGRAMEWMTYNGIDDSY